MIRLRTEGRTLPEVFAAYRACKALLARVLVPHPARVRPMSGYEEEMDPDLIYAERVFGSAPVGRTVSMINAQEEEWEKFIWRVDRGVNRLPAYQRDLVRVRFLGADPVSDRESHERLRAIGWGVGIGFFTEQKERALKTLSKRFRVEYERDPVS